MIQELNFLLIYGGAARCLRPSYSTIMLEFFSFASAMALRGYHNKLLTVAEIKRYLLCSDKDSSDPGDLFKDKIHRSDKDSYTEDLDVGNIVCRDM